MSDEELRDAAERCADGWGLARTQTAPMSVLRELVADAKAVGRAYLAGHTWQKEPPTVPGLYWWRQGVDQTAYWYDLVDDGCADLWARTFGHGQRSSQMAGEWCGPLNPPS